MTQRPKPSEGRGRAVRRGIFSLALARNYSQLLFLRTMDRQAPTITFQNNPPPPPPIHNNSPPQSPANLIGAPQRFSLTRLGIIGVPFSAFPNVQVRKFPTLGHLVVVYTRPFRRLFRPSDFHPAAVRGGRRSAPPTNLIKNLTKIRRGCA